MSYKTNLNKTVYDNDLKKDIPVERARLKAQLDDFATFQWRGHNMFDDFGCFIINDKNGSLKFYNGPGFTNQYAKSQFSSAANALLGIDFKQQTIPMKVGLYWFTIEEYQEFLECIGPYQINYLTFDFDKKYGYLVKSGKIADSVKHVVGADAQGNKRYYTELDLTWEVLGDACARSNLAYEYVASCSTNSDQDLICTWGLDPAAQDMTDDSLLNTPVVFELPCHFTNSGANLRLEAIAPVTNQPTLLFDIELENLTITSESDVPIMYNIKTFTNLENELKKKWTNYYYNRHGFYEYNSSSIISFDVKIENEKIDSEQGTDYLEPFTVNANNDRVIQLKKDDQGKANYCFYKITINGVDYIKSETLAGQCVLDFSTGQVLIPKEETDLTISIQAMPRVSSFNTSNMCQCPCKYSNTIYTHMFYVHNFETPSAEQEESISSIALYNKDDYSAILIVESSSSYYYPSTLTLQLVEAQLEEGLFNSMGATIDITSMSWPDLVPIYQNYIRYDSETGLMYIQEGTNSSWHLINYQYTQDGKTILKSADIRSWKLPGKFYNNAQLTTDWTFKLTYSNVELDKIATQQLNQAVTVYSRKNIV